MSLRALRVVLLLAFVVASTACTGSADQWTVGCETGYQQGRSDVLNGNEFNTTHEDPPTRKYTEGYLWGYDNGWTDGRDEINGTGGNHPIDWCSEENRP